MLLGKNTAGGAAGQVWENDGDVREVPDSIGLQLLSIGHAGFFLVDGPKPAEVQQEAPVIQRVVTSEKPASLADALTTANTPNKPRGTRSKA